MARCLGKLVWPCDHEQKHREAALLGWRRRHGAAGYRSDEEVAAFSAFAGHKVERAHTHPSHSGLVRFKYKSKWYELPTREWNNLVKEGKRTQRANAREESYQRAQERQLRNARAAEYKNVVRRIRQIGGIRPNRALSNGKIPELEEWQDLPRAVKTRDTRRGFALDDIAPAIAEEFPWLRVERGDDLAAYLQREARAQRNRKAG